MDKSSYRILVFSWNTASVSLCETMDPDIAEYNRTSYSNYIPGLTTWQYPCNIPDFFPKFTQLISDNSPDLIVIGFQEDRYPGSYFHSHLLPNEMPKIGYGLVKRTKLMGIGITSYKGILNGDPFERGIRVSIYAKDILIPLIEEMRNSMDQEDDEQSEYVCSSPIIRNKGATVSYITLPGFNQDTISPIRIAFVCCHLPFNPHSLIAERLYKNRMLRQNDLNHSNICFNNIIDNLVLFRDQRSRLECSETTLHSKNPSHVIYFGDFNYRLADPRPASKVANDFITKSTDIEFIHDMYMQYDELKEQMRRGNIYEFSEGINNQGPTFLPTCKMVKGREVGYDTDKSNVGRRNCIPLTDYWKTGSQNQRVPSWCDRILYSKFGKMIRDSSIGKSNEIRSTEKDNHNLICIYYDRFDVGEIMSKSDHAGVISIFELS